MRVGKGFKQKQKLNLNLILIGFFVSLTIIIVTTPIHEAAHWLMSDIDPYVEPVEIHVFDGISYQKQKHVLTSALGYVVIKEKYPGAFNDRPILMDTLQEIICISIQIFLAVIITFEIINRVIKRKQRFSLSAKQS